MMRASGKSSRAAARKHPVACVNASGDSELRTALQLSELLDRERTAAGAGARRTSFQPHASRFLYHAEIFRHDHRNRQRIGQIKKAEEAACAARHRMQG